MEECETATKRVDSGESIHVVAPGRVNLIGEHIDYLGGKVMPVAIDRHISIHAKAHELPSCEIVAEFPGQERKAQIDFSNLERLEKKEEVWLNYLIGVLKLTADSGKGLCGFSARISSTLPTGAGLSSSAALETAFSMVVDSFSGVERNVLERARLAQKAEHDFAGVPCGIMDQIAVGAGRADSAIVLDCAKEDWSYVELPSSWSLLIADTGVKHALGDGEYRKRRDQCGQILRILKSNSFLHLTAEMLEKHRDSLGDVLYRRARHVISEMKRVDDFERALEQWNADLAGACLRSSHDSLRDDYEVSCPELDALVDCAYEFGSERGLIGSRMTGGGFGGSTISLVEASAASNLERHLRKNYVEMFGRELDCFITRSVDGASVELVKTPIESQ